jgi:hypothetical protein
MRRRGSDGPVRSPHDGRSGRHAPRQADCQAEKKKTKAQREKDFRAAVWERDKSRSRASDKPLARSGTDFEKVGEVHHVLKRSTHPEDRLNPANGILLSKREHHLAETACPNAPDKQLLDIAGPADLGQPQTFIWRDIHGKQTKRRVG